VLFILGTDNMTLDQVDTSRFLVDPKKKNFIDEMVKLSNIFDFSVRGIGHKKLLIYITLMYDMWSYFRRDVKSFPQRKYEAAVCAGFALKEDGTFDDKIERVLVGSDDDFNKAVVQYVSLHYNLEYAKLVIYEYNYYKLIHKSFSQFDDRGNMRKLIDDLSNDINALEVKIFGGEETMSARKALYEGTSRSRLNLRPEQMVEEFAINKLRHLSPWGNYDLSRAAEVNFVGDSLPKSK
jgi:hypothetical protein